MNEPLIELVEATKIFRARRGAVRALDQVSFTVREGDVFGLLGANGAGKTTALRCILNLTRLNAGRLLVLGRERPDRRTLFARAAYLPEEPQFFQGATGREHLAYFGRLCGLRGPELRGRVAEVLRLVGLESSADRPIATYSKGMKQRAGIAGAILHRPKLFFLDEPTRGLDPIGRREIRDLLQKLAADGVTLFLNSHLLGEVERLCNRIAILDKGRLRAEGLLADLLTKTELIDVRFSLPESVPPAAFPEAERAPGGLWKEAVPDTAALAALAGRIAAAGGRVVSAQAARVELEDYFIRVVREGEPA
ncbi:MAG: ABC transporter ATP-binding protein [Myxococcales bacterium]|nr:ABC transporter ATP-binding protein [Myxococcales bacterium]